MEREVMKIFRQLYERVGPPTDPTPSQGLDLWENVVAFERAQKLAEELAERGSSVMVLKPEEPLPPGSDVLVEKDDGDRVIEEPVKYQPVRNELGLIIGWQRRLREDFK